MPGVQELCACVEPNLEGVTCEERAQVVCPGDLLCPAVVVECPRYNADLYSCVSEYTYEEDALDCALVAMRDRSVGKIVLDLENDECEMSGCGFDLVEITMDAEGLAMVTECMSTVTQAFSSTSTVNGLAEPAYFEECRGLASPAGRLACLRDGLTSNAFACR